MSEEGALVFHRAPLQLTPGYSVVCWKQRVCRGGQAPVVHSLVGCEESSSCPSPCPGCSSFEPQTPNCSFCLWAALQPHLAAFWASFSLLSSFIRAFFFSLRASVTNANTCCSRRVKPRRINVASTTLPCSNPVVIPLPAHPHWLCLLFKGSKWDP